MNSPLPWLAPHRDTPLVGEVLVPGSKSLTNRALILAALGDGPSVLERPLSSRDTTLMLEALTSLGANIQRDGVTWTITPPQQAATGNITVNCGLAGTVMRFVPPLAALTRAHVTFDGDERAYERPMSTTISALRSLGITIDDTDRKTLPFAVQGAGSVLGGDIELDASASSQFVSALLLVGAKFENGLTLRHVGASVPSMPHIDMTIAELRKRGVEVEHGGNQWHVKPGPIAAFNDVIEPDLSNAGAFIAGALVTGGRIRIRHWPRSTEQAGDAWRKIAVDFGGSVERDGDDLIFTGPQQVNGVDLDLHDVGELTPVIAAVAAFAEGPSRLRGIAHLRGHETDRLAALAAEFNALGGEVTELDDGLAIVPRPLHGGTFSTYHDHRMAHAAVVAGLRVPELFVENVATTVKTYPNFAPVWERLAKS